MKLNKKRFGFARQVILATVLICLFSNFVFADSATISCKKEGHYYKISFNVTVSAKRLILVGVVDENGNGHRVYRYFLTSREKSDEITIHENKFGPLRQACIAVHLTKGDKRTVASDCDYF